MLKKINKKETVYSSSQQRLVLLIKILSEHSTVVSHNKSASKELFFSPQIKLLPLPEQFCSCYDKPYIQSKSNVKSNDSQKKKNALCFFEMMIHLIHKDK